MKATGKLVETYDNYTRLIKEIEGHNAEFKELLSTTSEAYRRIAYYDAIIKNDRAINEIALKRLKMTTEVFAI